MATIIQAKCVACQNTLHIHVARIQLKSFTFFILTVIFYVVDIESDYDLFKKTC